MTALELMPVAQFPGSRNWGYDGVYPFAVQNSYGGPEGLRRLVDACHEHGLAVVLDVVYNHLGPEGNYLGDFGPYFTDQYRSPWGQAINFDGPESDEVVRFFTENALYWLRDFHIDALRLDAIHGIVDCNAQPFLRLLAQAVHEFAEQSGRKIYLIAESDLNDVRYIQPAESGGYGLDAQWSDDFHHAVHALLTGEQSGYYLDFGGIEHLGKAFEEGFVYSGQYLRLSTPAPWQFLSADSGATVRGLCPESRPGRQSDIWRPAKHSGVLRGVEIGGGNGDSFPLHSPAVYGGGMG